MTHKWVSVKILGIDPGSSVAGFACIQARKLQPILPRDFAIIDVGVMRFDKKLQHSLRISQLHRGLIELIDSFKPDVCVVEKAFCGVNASSALKLGEARGALIAGVYARGVDYREITPREAKKVVTGKGHASKEEVAFALKMLLGFDKGTLSFDAADALAIALSYGLSGYVPNTSKLADAIA